MLKYLFLFLYIFTSLAYASHNKFQKLEKVSLQLHWKYQFEFAGFIAAKEKGFYKDLGLDVTLKEYQDGMDIEDEILSGRSEYGIYNSLSLLEYLRGKNLILLSSYFKRAALVLVTAPNIKTPKDLVGKKVMATTRDDFILNFQPYFDSYNVNIDDVELVKHTYSIDDFVDGKVSAMPAFVSNELYKLNERGVKYNILDPGEDNLFVLQMELITSKKEAQTYPLRVKAFREASIKGWMYALSHKDEIIELIHTKYAPQISKKSLRDEAIGVEKLILPFTYKIGSIDKNFLTKQMELFKSYYKVQTNRALQGFIFNDASYFKDIVFSEEELHYIQEHKNINVCVNYGLFPIDGYEDGKMTGIMADVFGLISEKTSFKFHAIQAHSEEDLMKNLQNNRCEILTIVSRRNQNFTSLHYSKIVSKTSFALISKLDKSFVEDVKLLKGKLLLVQKKSFKEYLYYLYPFLKIEVDTNKNSMVQKVLNNKAYAILTINEQADYFIEKYGYGKLKINAFLANKNPLEGSIGVQKDEPILLSIINKSLHTISKTKIENIINSWRITRYQKSTNYALVFVVLGIMSLILLIMFYYHRRLQNFNKELESVVDEKTRALREINEYLEDTVSQKIEELIQKDEILTVQSKQAVMGEMISMIAHQWRQPLNMITLNISNIQIKQMMGETLNPDKLNTSLEDISNAIIYLSDTIDDFKTYFHPDKEKSLLKVDTIIEKAINFVSARLDSNSIKLEYIQAPKLKIEVYTNELIQVLLNIINNAIDAYENKDLQKKIIKIHTESNSEELIIKIQDSAGGIAQKNLSKIFEPYFSTKGKNGTGLGLYMSQMIIEKQFKGKISIDTLEEKTIFSITFPTVYHS